MGRHLDPTDVAAGLLLEARAVATQTVGVRVAGGDGSPLDLLHGVWRFFATERRTTGREALALAEQAVERACAAHGHDRADAVAVFDAALEELAASPRRRPGRA